MLRKIERSKREVVLAEDEVSSRGRGSERVLYVSFGGGSVALN